MDIQKKSVKLTDDTSIIVCEAGANYDARFSQAMIEADKCEDADKTLVFFFKTFYPILSACTENAPSAQDAYALDHKKLDEWYLAVWELNPELLGPLPVVHTEEVIFRDGSKIVLAESHGFPSFVLRLVQMENDAQERADTPADEHSFRNYIYPKIAACVVSENIPDVDMVVSAFPHAEIARWSAIAMKLNKNWFDFIFDEAEKEKVNSEEVKKKTSRRVRSKKA